MSEWWMVLAGLLLWGLIEVLLIIQARKDGE